MIETVSQFLEEFKTKGLEQIKIQDSDITHPVTIGDIHEGLTSEILNRSIFKGLDLKIVKNSFIYNESGHISKEMDCMIVIGNGKQISFTDRYKYHIKNVIAVVQVKKRLYKNAIDDAHQNLKSVIDTAEPRDGEAYMSRIHQDAYKTLMSKELPTKDKVKTLSWREQMLYHFLLMQAFWPLRILIGYDSYKTEYGLREGFVEHLEQLTINGPCPGYSPISFPDLMICGNNTIIKNVGMPFSYPLDFKKEFYWENLLSSPEKPMYLLLELIWTRLSYKFSLGSQIFGDDFALDTMHPFLRTKERKIDKENFGWEYTYHTLTQKQLSEPLISTPWEPVELELFEQVILIRLSENREIECDSQLEDYFSIHDTNIEKIISKWTEKRIAYKNGNKIILLLDEPIFISEPDGKIYIGENRNGEMMNWMSKKASI